jgi:hypothetical protein
VDGDQVRIAQRRFLERVREPCAGVLGIADAHRDLAVHGHALLPDHDHRAWRTAGDVPAHRAERHRHEAARPARAHDEHGRVGAAFRHSQRRRPGQQPGRQRQARRYFLGPGDGGVERPL